jgi:hypothetical protein
MKQLDNFLSSPMPNFMKIYSGVLQLLYAYSQTDGQTDSNFERHSAGMRTHLKSGFSKTINRRLNTLRQHASGRAKTFATVQHPLYKQWWTNGVGTNNSTAHGLKKKINLQGRQKLKGYPFPMQ